MILSRTEGSGALLSITDWTIKMFYLYCLKVKVMSLDRDILKYFANDLVST